MVWNKSLCMHACMHVHCKNIWVTWTIISVISVACVSDTHHEVQELLLNKSSEDLESKMLRSFSLVTSVHQSSFQNTNRLAFLEKAWLHRTSKKAKLIYLDGIQETFLEAFLGLLIMIPLWCN